jgi:hypothetical protein
MELPCVIPVEYRGELVALVSRERIHIISPRLSERPTGDPELRFVGYMCACYVEALNGRLPGDITSDIAERWARAALLGPDALRAVAERADIDAARALNVPLAQLRAPRAEYADA